jgi:hypothetical protein
MFELKKPLVIKTKGLPKEKWFDIVRDRIRHLPG